MKIKPKVTTAAASLLPLLLLSAIIDVEPYYSGVLSRRGLNQRATPIEDCENSDAINVWFNKQFMLSNVLAQHILHMDTLLNETCDFYDIEAMQLLYDNVEEINRSNGGQSGELPKLSGEMEKDLEQILPWIKKLVPKGFKDQGCCEELEKSLNETKETLKDKWEDFKNEISEEIGKGNTKIKKDLQEKQETLVEQREKSVKRLLKIQEDNIGSNSKNKCCSKFDKKIKYLLNQLNEAKNEANDDTQKIDEKLKKIKDKLKNQDKKATEAKEALEKRSENIKESLHNYANNYTNLVEKQSKDSNCSKEGLEKRIQELEERVKGFADSIGVLGASTKLNITLCLENSEKLARIESMLKKLLVDIKIEENGVPGSGNTGSGNGSTGNGGIENEGSGNGSSGDVGMETRVSKGSGNETSDKAEEGKRGSGNAGGSGNKGSGNTGDKNGGSETDNSDCVPDTSLEDRVKALQQEIDKLREILKKSQTCCGEIDQLYATGDKLLKSVKHINQTVDDHIKNSALDLGEIERLLKEGKDKLGALKKNSQAHEEGSGNETGEDFQKQLINLQAGLDKAKEDLKNLHNKLSELPNPQDKPTNSGHDEVSDMLKDQMKNFNSNWIKADQRLRQLEERAREKSSEEKKKRLERLAKLIEALRQDLDKSEGEILRLEEPEQLYKANMEKLNTLEKKIKPCRDSCKELDKMNDLIDNIEDLEMYFGSGKSLQIRPPGKNGSKKPGDALIGGIDYVEQKGTERTKSRT